MNTRGARRLFEDEEILTVYHHFAWTSMPGDDWIMFDECLLIYGMKVTGVVQTRSSNPYVNIGHIV
jgi:hypothetical protein